MKYFVAALVVSLGWLLQDSFIWEFLVEVDRLQETRATGAPDHPLALLGNTGEHELKFGLPVGLSYHVSLSFLTAAVWFLAVWKAWPTELEQWAGAGSGRGRGRGQRPSRGQRGDRKSSQHKSDDRQNDGNRPRRRRSRGRRGGGRGGRGEASNQSQSR